MVVLTYGLGLRGGPDACTPLPDQDRHVAVADPAPERMACRRLYPRLAEKSLTVVPLPASRPVGHPRQQRDPYHRVDHLQRHPFPVARFMPFRSGTVWNPSLLLCRPQVRGVHPQGSGKEGGRPETSMHKTLDLRERFRTKTPLLR